MRLRMRMRMSEELSENNKKKRKRIKRKKEKDGLSVFVCMDVLRKNHGIGSLNSILARIQFLLWNVM